MNQESLINILMYVYENYIEDPDFKDKSDSKLIISEMLKDGFNAYEIDRALVWFGELNELQQNVALEYKKINTNALRILTPAESSRLTAEAQQYLLQLEQLHIIDPVSRELILDRVMALNEVIVDVYDIKWVALLVLSYQPDKQDELSELEELILLRDEGTKH